MWIFSRHGFFSVVRADPDEIGQQQVMVRARVRADLERLIAEGLLRGAEILEWPGRDYPYRVIVHRDEWAETMQEIAYDIDYRNFKATVGDTDGPARAALYARVWGEMLEAEAELGHDVSNHSIYGRR